MVASLNNIDDMASSHAETGEAFIEKGVSLEDYSVVLQAF